MGSADFAVLFRKHGLPLTPQRRAIFQRLRASKAHPSAEDIHRSLRRRCPELSLATVYKTLHVFQRLGLASLVNAPHAEARYDAITGTHHHAICVDCGRIDDLFDRRLDRLKAPRRARGFKTLSHSVHFLGRCTACAKKASLSRLRGKGRVPHQHGGGRA